MLNGIKFVDGCIITYLELGPGLELGPVCLESRLHSQNLTFVTDSE